jgi:hypothetical protein
MPYGTIHKSVMKAAGRQPLTGVWVFLLFVFFKVLLKFSFCSFKSWHFYHLDFAQKISLCVPINLSTSSKILHPGCISTHVPYAQVTNWLYSFSVLQENVDWHPYANLSTSLSCQSPKALYIQGLFQVVHKWNNPPFSSCVVWCHFGFL